MSDLIPFKSGMDVVEYGQTAIEEIDDIQDLKNIDIKANALQAREPKEVWNALFSVASHCRRKAGSILADPEFERAQQGDNQYGSNTLLLADLGVDKMEASRWMALSVF